MKILPFLASYAVLVGAASLPKRDSNNPQASTYDVDHALETVSIAAPDGSIKASFIRAGAHITNLYVKDKSSNFIDVILGYDDRSLYLSDPAHPYCK